MAHAGSHSHFKAKIDISKLARIRGPELEVNANLFREFTRDILATNHQNAASTLINRANDRLSISFVLAGSFEQQFPELHAAFSAFRKACPGLAAAYDPYFGSDGFLLTDELELSSIEIEGDANHRKPLALHGLPARWVRSRRDPLLRVVDPRNETADSEFM